jgi:hypothetical protein
MRREEIREGCWKICVRLFGEGRLSFRHGQRNQSGNHNGEESVSFSGFQDNGPSEPNWMEKTLRGLSLCKGDVRRRP